MLQTSTEGPRTLDSGASQPLLVLQRPRKLAVSWPLEALGVPACPRGTVRTVATEGAVLIEAKELAHVQLVRILVGRPWSQIYTSDRVCRRGLPRMHGVCTTQELEVVVGLPLEDWGLSTMNLSTDEVV